MGTYRTVLQKSSQGGYAGSPEQQQGNAGSPFLERGLSIRDGIVGAVGYTYGKQVFNAVFTASVDQIGNSRLEKGINYATKGMGYVFLGIATGGVALPAAAALVEVISIGITTAVENHAINLDNNRLRIERGTRVNFGAGGHYG